MSAVLATVAAWSAEDWFFYVGMPFIGGLVTGLLPLVFINWGKP